MAGEQWFQYNITNPHSSDDGVDIGTPNNTPVYFPYSGQVIDANYYTYGGQVVVFDGTGYDEYFIHLNNILVKKGQEIPAGTEIGTTGGGVGDKLANSRGQVYTATSQADFGGSSSGYHTEFGEFKDTSAHGDMGQFNEGWGGQGGKRNGRQADPTGLIDEMRANANSWQQTIASIQSGMFGGQAGQAGAQAGQQASSAVQQAASAADPSTWGPAILSSLGFSTPGDAFSRIGGVVGGMALIALGLFVAFHSEAQQIVQNVEKVAGTAAKAAAL